MFALAPACALAPANAQVSPCETFTTFNFQLVNAKYDLYVAVCTNKVFYLSYAYLVIFCVEI